MPDEHPEHQAGAHEPVDQGFNEAAVIVNDPCYNTTVDGGPGEVSLNSTIPFSFPDSV